MDLTPAKEPPRPLLLVETFSDVPGAHHRDLGFERDLEALGASIIPLALLSVHQGSEKQLGENSKPAPQDVEASASWWTDSDNLRGRPVRLLAKCLS